MFPARKKASAVSAVYDVHKHKMPENAYTVYMNATITRIPQEVIHVFFKKKPRA